jgi:hypothetical protein
MKRHSACNGPGPRWLAVALLALALAAAAWAQSPPPPADDAEKAQLRQEIEQLKKALAAMEKRLDAVEKAEAQPAAPKAVAPPLPQPPLEAPKPEGPKPSMSIYGFAMVDMGQNFTQINPNWFDTMRVSRLPKYENEFGEDNSTFAGVRQSRFGVKASVPTGLGELKTKFEFDMFGTGGDEGQTTIRLRHAYGELGWFLAGQTDSIFSDPDVWPNSLEYWGPSGMVFFRNVQVRFTPVQDGTHWLAFALERPGASGDAGVYSDRIEIQNIKGRNPLPDFTAAYKYSGDWGYFKVGGLLRRIAWDDLLDDQYDLSGHATGWGVNFSSCVNVTARDILRMEINYGRGDENYMQDAPVDIGIENNFDDPVRPIIGKPLPLLGTHIFLDHNWNDQFSSSIGYSRIDIDNTDGQAPDALRVSQYALCNLLYSPFSNFMVGGEFQWGQRSNFSDGFHSSGYKFQFSAKYNFNYTLGGKNE